jgi:hypothetical protein
MKEQWMHEKTELMVGVGGGRQRRNHHVSTKGTLEQNQWHHTIPDA